MCGVPELQHITSLVPLQYIMRGALSISGFTLCFLILQYMGNQVVRAFTDIVFWETRDSQSKCVLHTVDPFLIKWLAQTALGMGMAYVRNYIHAKYD